MSNELNNLLGCIHQVEVSLVPWKTQTCLWLHFENGGENLIARWIDFFDYTLAVQDLNEVNVSLFIHNHWNWGYLYVFFFFLIIVVFIFCVVVFLTVIIRVRSIVTVFFWLFWLLRFCSIFTFNLICFFRNHKCFLHKVIWKLNDHLGIELGIIFVFLSVVDNHLHAYIKILRFTIISNGIYLIKCLCGFKQYDLCVSVIWVH